MLIDLHMHEMTYSKDSFLALPRMVEIAREKGLDGICITDHDSMGLKDFAEEYSGKTGFPIFTGIEYYSLQGDIVAFGIEDYPRERIPAQEFINLVKAQGGVCFAAHPFRNNRRGLEEHLCEVTGGTGRASVRGDGPGWPGGFKWQHVACGLPEGGQICGKTRASHHWRKRLPCTGKSGRVRHLVSGGSTDPR